MFYAAFVGSSIVLDLESAWHRAEVCLTSENKNHLCFKTSRSCSSGVHQLNCRSARHSELSDTRMGSESPFV